MLSCSTSLSIRDASEIFFTVNDAIKYVLDVCCSLLLVRKYKRISKMYLWGILYDDMKETIPILLQQMGLVDGVGKVPFLKIVHYCIYADIVSGWVRLSSKNVLK